MPKTPMPPPPDPRNVQGLILHGYTHPYSCHMLFSFADQAGATGFIGALMPHVQTAQRWDTKPPSMLNIGLTYNGIKTFDAMFNGKLAGQFPPEFQAGPWSPQPQSSLQDSANDTPPGPPSDPSDPSLWWNGYDNTAIHCIVHSYGLNADALSGLVEIVSQAARANRLTEVLPLTSGNGRLEEYAPLGDFIHFGYHDGIDNPGLDWPQYQEDTQPGDANNFVIGYPGSSSHPGPQDGSVAAAFAKDGCYNAFRVFYQDVGAFDQFLADNAQTVVQAIGGSLDNAKEWLAAKMVGRWRNGSPLIRSPDAPDPKTSDCKKFGYSADTAGVKCPFSAHSRVANPRDEPTFPGTDTPVPRIARRGMPYGVPAVPPDYSGERGLIGLFLCGSLANQFEKLYSWMNTNNFSAVFPNGDTQDALIANRVPPAFSSSDTDPSFTIPMPNGNPIVIPTLPQFLVTRGTAYCLLPSIATLQQLAKTAK
jgi:deferrochelatase/peroxidase EfeB